MEMRQQHDQNFPIEGVIVEQILASEEKKKSKEQDYKNHNLGSK